MVTEVVIEVELDCVMFGPPPIWIKRSDLCDRGVYTNYTNCNGQRTCTVPHSELLQEGRSFFCCFVHQEFCYEFICEYTNYVKLCVCVCVCVCMRAPMCVL